MLPMSTTAAALAAARVGATEAIGQEEMAKIPYSHVRLTDELTEFLDDGRLTCPHCGQKAKPEAMYGATAGCTDPIAVRRHGKLHPWRHEELHPSLIEGESSGQRIA